MGLSQHPTSTAPSGKKVLFPIPRIDQEMVRYLRDRIEADVFRPVIDRRYPFDQIAEAYRYVETGQKVSKRRDHDASRRTLLSRLEIDRADPSPVQASSMPGWGRMVVLRTTS